jgi:hypothetical protein
MHQADTDFEIYGTPSGRGPYFCKQYRDPARAATGRHTW